MGVKSRNRREKNLAVDGGASDSIPQNQMDKYRDAGTLPSANYKPHMSSYRYRIREYLLPIVEAETPVLYSFQQSLRTKFLDEYFIYSANLGSHTFYVLCLPISRWLCFSKISRDLIFLLGYSIYASGYVKDFLCLPRPRAPPLKRITHSAYTTKEYGAPSSHTANATSVSLFLVYLLFLTHTGDDFSYKAVVLPVVGIFLYYFTLTVGRVYSGMHGFFDIESGILIGALVFIIRLYIRDTVELLLKHWWYPVLNVLFGLFLLFTHIRPIDDCPCFKDSVAFIGVLGGMEFSDWLYPYVFKTETYELHWPAQQDSSNTTIITFFLNKYITGYFELSPIYKLSIRCALGVICVLVWKEVVAEAIGFILGDSIKDKDKTLKPAKMITTKEHPTRDTKHLSSKDTQNKNTRIYKGLSTQYILWKYFVYFMVAFVSIIIAPYVFYLFGVY